MGWHLRRVPREHVDDWGRVKPLPGTGDPYPIPLPKEEREEEEEETPADPEQPEKEPEEEEDDEGGEKSFRDEYGRLWNRSNRKKPNRRKTTRGVRLGAKRPASRKRGY